MDLGSYLKDARLNYGLTLRESEHHSGISNAYISQIENNKIKQPSPLILEALAKIYDLDYSKLMRMAGYKYQSNKSNHQDFLAQHSVTKKEEKELIDYLAFIRRNK